MTPNVSAMNEFDLEVLRVVLQAVSSFAIAGGLLYTAVQFRQARKAQLVANFSKLVELQYQLRHIRVQHPGLASVHKQLGAEACTGLAHGGGRLGRDSRRRAYNMSFDRMVT